MKTIKPIFLVLLIAAIIGVAVRVAINRQRQNQQVAAQRAASQRAARAAELQRMAPPPLPERAPEPAAVPPPAIETPPATEPAISNRPVALQPTPPPSGAPTGTEVRQDPMARAALSLVGVDPYAEAYWLDAIYDTSLSDSEREDLMEDLNEEGLSNPRHPAPEDFPLIANRLRILEELIPNITDPFMQVHIWEAYKDLSLLYAGEPAR